MTSRMPVLFIAHGNPLDARGGTRFSAFLGSWSREFPRPEAVLCISAHWERHQMAVTAAPHLKTIHDFYGFPPPLFEIRYPAPGDPEFAEGVRDLLRAKGYQCDMDVHHGLDHGSWIPLRFLYPEADVPVVQLSIPTRRLLTELPEIGKTLAPFRQKKILIMGSGNIVHNRDQVRCMDRDAPPKEWASHFDNAVKNWILSGDVQSLTDPWKSSKYGKISNPSLEHYIPLLITLGATDENDRVSFPYEGFEYGSVSMRCVQFG